MKIEDIWIKGKQCQLVSDFRDDDEMREKFYKLPKEFFGVDFKAWYELGGWGEGYNPHCLLYQGEVVSNVGVAYQEYIIDGQLKKIIQLGSVGTWKQYRGEGLSRYLMEYVIEKYKDENDAIMLFGNDSVVEFYPKFGFKKAKEYCAVKYISAMNQPKASKEYSIRKLNAKNEEDRALACKIASVPYEEAYFAVSQNVNLLRLYWEIFNCVTLYYIQELDTVVVAEYGENSLEISEVYGKARLEEVISVMCQGIQCQNTPCKEIEYEEAHSQKMQDEEVQIKVMLGFTPKHIEEYELEEYKEEDATLFILGETFKEQFDKGQLRIPSMSHT